MKTQLSKAPKQVVNRDARDEISTAGPDSRRPEAPRAETDAASAAGRDEIAALAYRYWEERGCLLGCPEEDWYRAERELASRSNTIQ